MAKIRTDAAQIQLSLRTPACNTLRNHRAELLIKAKSTLSGSKALANSVMAFGAFGLQAARMELAIRIKRATFSSSLDTFFHFHNMEILR